MKDLKIAKRILREAMPEVNYSELGRVRLARALQMKHGKNFRNIPDVKDALKEFDDHYEFNKKLKRIKEGR